MYTRTGPGEGSCAGRGYPCVHGGLDLAGEAGTPVRAPEDGVSVWWGDGSARPGTGYGPGWRILRGRSGTYHMLAHLDLPDLRRRMGSHPMHEYTDGVRVREGDVVGVTSAANHVHWETRPRVRGRSDNPHVWVKNATATSGGFVEELRANAAEIGERNTSESGGALLLVALLLLRDELW